MRALRHPRQAQGYPAKSRHGHGLLPRYFIAQPLRDSGLPFGIIIGWRSGGQNRQLLVRKATLRQQPPGLMQERRFDDDMAVLAFPQQRRAGDDLAGNATGLQEIDKRTCHHQIWCRGQKLPSRGSHLDVAGERMCGAEHWR